MKILTYSLTFIMLPISIYASWLLYNHVQATELMWFLFWFLAPFQLLLSVLSKFIEDKK